MDSICVQVGGVLVEGVLVADRFGTLLFADFGVEPAAGIEPARLSGQRHAPLAEALFEECVVQPRQVADLANAEQVQVLLRHLAHARHLAHVERRQKGGLDPGGIQMTPLGLAWSEVILATRRDAAIPIEQFRVAAFMRSCSRWAAPGAARTGAPCR